MLPKRPILLFLICCLASHFSNAAAPTITIKASANYAICPGTMVVFTATITNGGSAPVYQWRKNWNPVGTNSNVYQDNSLKNGDVITCILTSNAPFANPASVTGNYISIAVNDGQQPKIFTYAGFGASYYGIQWGNWEDGYRADSSSIASPLQLAFNSKGDLYICEGWSNNQIRKITMATGIKSTVTGKVLPLTGSFSGDGGPAVLAGTSRPIGLCVDSHDNLIFADANNNRIRKIDAVTGIINTIAGNGFPDSTGNGGLAVNATISFPSGMCIDSADNIYFMDSGNGHIRKINAGTGIITLIARGYGNPNGFGQNYYESICMGPCNELYFSSNNVIRKINLNSGNVSIVTGSLTNPRGFAGDGMPAIHASFNIIRGLNFDKWGNLYICDILNNRVRKIDAVTGIIYTVAGNGNDVLYGDSTLAVMSGMAQPVHVLPDKAGNLYIACELNSRIRRVTTTVANQSAKQPVINFADSNLCKGNTVTLDISRCGDSLYGLNGAKEWRWYAGSCGGTFIGRGASITVSPTVTTTYFVRGEGDCIPPGPCAAQTIYVYDPVNVTVNISSNPSGTVCRGTPITFSASAVNAGSTPQYIWKRNGVTVASASNSFTTTGLRQNDVINCVLRSNVICAVPDSVVSNNLQVDFFPDTVKVSPVNAAICLNGNIQLTAAGGFAYQWHYNGVVIPGATSPLYNATAPGAYLVKVTNVNCVIPDSAIVILDNPIAVVSPSSALICPGKIQLLTATPGNGYQWFLNGNALAGETSITHTATVAGKYAVRVSDSLCATLSEEAVLTPGRGPKPVRYEMTRVARNKSYGLTARNIGINYNWQPVTGLNNPSIKNPVVTTAQDRTYLIQISVPGQCEVTDTLEVIVFDKPGVYVPTAFTPDGNGSNDLLRPIPVHIRKLVYFRVWNRWGGLVYNTTLMNAGWNGKVNGKPVDPGVYVWSCEAVDEDGKTIVLKGTTVLIR